MLGIGCPDRHALPRITSSKNAPTATRAPIPRERVRSSARRRHPPGRRRWSALHPNSAVRRCPGGGVILRPLRPLATTPGGLDSRYPVGAALCWFEYTPLSSNLTDLVFQEDPVFRSFRSAESPIYLEGMAEHLALPVTLNQRVADSSPAAPTNQTAEWL